MYLECVARDTFQVHYFLGIYRYLKTALLGMKENNVLLAYYVYNVNVESRFTFYI